MRPPGCWSLNSLICSTAASKSSPVWTTRNNGSCSWSLLGSKSSAHDTEARMRKFAERRILASPSLSKMLFPTSIVAKDCRFRMVTLPAFTQIATGRPIERRPSHLVICRGSLVQWKSWCRNTLASSAGGSPLSQEGSWSNFEELYACSREAFINVNVRFEFPISLYTFGYIGLVLVRCEV